MTEPSATAAHDHLDLAARSGLDATRDRRIHAASMAGLGLSTGLIPLLIHGGTSSAHDVFFVAFVVLLVLFSAWQARAASVPRHAARISWTGAALSVALIGVGIAVLGAVAPDAWWQSALVFAVVAAPMVIAGALIARQGPA